MREYGKVSPRFWTGTTGKAIRGERDVQLVCLYLTTCASSTMVGLYYLPLPTLCHETGLTPKAAKAALKRVAEVEFAFYDPASELVWVPNMACWQIGPSLSASDKRCKGILKAVEQFLKHEYGWAFLDRYAKAYHLAIPETVRPFLGPSKGLPVRQKGLQTELEGPSKPGAGTGAVEQEQEQEQEQPPAPPPARALSPVPDRPTGREAPPNPLVDRPKLEREGYELVEFLKGHVDLDPTEILKKASAFKGRSYVRFEVMPEDRLAHTVASLRAWKRSFTGEREAAPPAPHVEPGRHVQALTESSRIFLEAHGVRSPDVRPADEPVEGAPVARRLRG